MGTSPHTVHDQSGKLRIDGSLCDEDGWYNPPTERNQTGDRRRMAWNAEAAITGDVKTKLLQQVQHASKIADPAFIFRGKGKTKQNSSRSQPSKGPKCRCCGDLSILLDSVHRKRNCQKGRCFLHRFIRCHDERSRKQVFRFGVLSPFYTQRIVAKA